jgi:TIR domain
MPANDTTDYVFISYSRRDRPFVDQLVNNLSLRGVKVWQDVKEIKPGANWAKEIQRALFEAAVLLFVASQNSAESSWMAYELTEYIEKGGKIIPIILDDVGASQLPSPIAQFQWVDFRLSYEEALHLLLISIPENLKRDAPQSPKSKKSKGYVFLSYAEEDADFIEELKLFLKKRRYAYWDYAESDRNYHISLFLELESVISEAVATLSILSPEWKKSRWTIKEYVFSDEVGIPVFLLKAKEVGPTLAVAGDPYIDFVKDRSAGFKKLERELSRKGL